MRSEVFRKLLAALVVMTVWFVSLVVEARQTQGASPAESVTVTDVMRLEATEHAVLVEARRREGLDRAERMRIAQEQRKAREDQLVQWRMLRAYGAQYEEQVGRIADLVPVEYHNLVLEMAARYEIDPRIIAAVGTVESRWDPNCVGRDDDTGLMQILPSTAEWIAGRMGLSDYDLFDPHTNMLMGSWYLQLLYNAHDGDWNKALAEYNGGPRAAAAGANHPYTKRVMAVYHRQGG